MHSLVVQWLLFLQDQVELHKSTRLL